MWIRLGGQCGFGLFCISLSLCKGTFGLFYIHIWLYLAYFYPKLKKKSRIRETLNLSTGADSSIDTKTDKN